MHILFESDLYQLQSGLDLASDESGSSQKLLGTVNVVLKVTVSCLAAVLTDRYTKHFKDPVYIQAIQLRLSRTLLSLWLQTVSASTLFFISIFVHYRNRPAIHEMDDKNVAQKDQFTRAAAPKAVLSGRL